MTTFCLVRHGQNDKVPGDQPLNLNGQRQAKATAACFKHRAVNAVYASPLARARQTAQYVATAVGLPIHVDVRLRERANYGDLPGQTLPEFVAMWEQCDQDRNLVPVVGLSSRANGERLEEWMKEVQHLHPQNIIVVGTHGGTITDFLRNQFSTAVLEGHRANYLHNIGHCSITTIDYDVHVFRLQKLAAVDHLLDVNGDQLRGS